MQKTALLKLKKELESQYLSDIAAIDRLIERLDGKGIQGIPCADVGSISVYQAVSKAVDATTGDFSIQDILRQVSFPRNPVSAAVFRLKVQRSIEIVQAGSGRKGAIYRKVKSSK